MEKPIFKTVCFQNKGSGDAIFCTFLSLFSRLDILLRAVDVTNFPRSNQNSGEAA